MPDREKVIKGLGCCLKTLNYGPCPADCPYLMECFKDITTIFMPIMLDALELLKEQEPGWISVKDRLPEDGKHVLVACTIKCLSGKLKHYVCEAFYAGKYSILCSVYDDLDADYDEETDEYYFPEGWWECIHNWDEYQSVAIDDFVTHWMPLPEPPKES